MHVVRFSDAPSFEPAGHAGVINKLLAGASLKDGPEVSVWHGTFEPGGAAEPHVHDSSVQIYVALEGSFVVGGGGVADVMVERNDAVVIPAGEVHTIKNRSDRTATVLVISAPALR